MENININFSWQINGKNGLNGSTRRFFHSKKLFSLCKILEHGGCVEGVGGAPASYSKCIFYSWQNSLNNLFKVPNLIYENTNPLGNGPRSLIVK